MKFAYALIHEYKAGTIAPGSEISVEQQRLLHLLGEDLEIDIECVTTEQLVLLVAKADSIWNKRTMAVIDNFYTLREAGHVEEAERARSAFIQECPSVWYCDIVREL